MAEKRYFGRIRKTATALAVALVALGAIVVPPPAPVSAACDLTPVVRDSMVNQGVESYPTLARGKETLVKFFLTKPSCATAEDDIKVVGGSLRVTPIVSGIPLPETTIPTPTPSLGEVFPSISAFGTAANNAAGDPVFVVDGDLLAPPLWTGKFEIRFTATIDYRSKPGGSATYGTVQKTPPVSVTGTVGAKQNKLRLLLVPMGDASQTPWAEKQFPAGAETVVQRSMVTLSRVLPVSDGVALFSDASPEASKAGIRYGFSPTVVDLGPNGLKLMSATQKFCGTADNWTRVAPQLTAALQAFNTREENKANPADRVLGVIWDGVSEGAGTRNNCAEGWANVSGREAWTRAVTAANPSPTGAIAAMEIMHTLGQIRSSDWERYTTGYHSKNREADVTAPNRGYNVSLREWLLDDRSALNFSPPGWDEYSVLLELQDWNVAQCRLTEGSAAGAPCSDPGDVGSSAAAASDAIVLTGSLTETTTDLHTYFEATTLTDAPSDSREYTLVQRTAPDAAASLAGPVFGIPVSNQASAHDHDDVADHEHTTVVDTALPVYEGAVRFEVWQGAPGSPGAKVIYARNRDSEPVIHSTNAVPTSVSEKNLTSTQSATESQPALAPDGSRIAYVAPDPANGDQPTVFVRSVAGGAMFRVGAGAEPAWNAAGDRLAFVRNGSVYTAAANGSDTPTVIYDKALQTDLLFPNASGPSWRSDGGEIAVSIQGDLWGLSTTARLPIKCIPAVQLGDCRQITRTADLERDPSWRPAAAAGLSADAHDIAYSVTSSDAARNGVWTLDSTGTGSAPAPRIAGGAFPEWGGSRLFFVKDGSIGVVDASSFDTTHSLTTGSWPAPAANGETFGFQRAGDIWIAQPTGWTITVVASDDTATELRADFFLECGSVYPIAVDEQGAPQPDGTTKFTLLFDASLGCEGRGTGSVRVTDGWTTVTEDFGTITSNKAPVGAIYGPGTVLQYDAIPLKANVQDDAGVASSVFLLSGPSTGGAEVVVGAGTSPPDAEPPLPGGWSPGLYTLVLEVVDVDGLTTRVTTSFPILADSDNDNQPDEKERLACYPAGAEFDGTNGSANYDGDLWVNVDDPDPCSSAYNATIDFEPNSVQVTASSGPDVITLYVSSSAGPLRSIDPSTVRIVRVGDSDVSLFSTRWFLDSKSKQWTAQFDRKAFQSLIPLHLVGGYVPVVIRGDGGTFSFLGSDPVSPVTSL